MKKHLRVFAISIIILGGISAFWAALIQGGGLWEMQGRPTIWQKFVEMVNWLWPIEAIFIGIYLLVFFLFKKEFDDED